MSKPLDVATITPAEISEAIGLPVGVLFKIAAHSDKFYLPTRILVTATRKTRELDVPKRFLRLALRKLHRFIQRKELYSEAAHGAIRRLSSFTSAEQHLGKQAVAIRDVSNCYPSIGPSRLRSKLLKLGFRSDTACLLTGLMTCRERIPQGASTSGDALNLFLWDLDIQVLNFCGDGINYTRMADDHVISGNDIDRVNAAVQFLEDRIRADGLVVNEAKKNEKGLTEGMAVAPGRQCVHSIGVNHSFKTRIPRDRQKEYVEFGMRFVRAALAVSANSLSFVAAKRRQLMGYINYSRQADLSSADQLRRLLERGDQIVCRRLRKEGVTRSKKWWFYDGTHDRSIELSRIWTLKRRAKVERGTPLAARSCITGITSTKS